MECMIHLQDTVCRAYERTNWEKVWEAITRRRWDGFKELYEILAVVDVRCYSLRAGCWGYHMLIALAEERLGKAEVGYIDFGETIKKSGAWRLWWGEGKDRTRGHREAIEKCSIWRLPFEGGERRMYKFQGGHSKVKYMKSPKGSDDFWLFDL